MKNYHWSHRYYGYTVALKQLYWYLEYEPTTQLEQLGLIKTFEITLERALLAIKAFRRFQEPSDIKKSATATMAVQWAIEQKLIRGLEMWKQIIHDRNRTAHFYDSKMAKQVMHRIKEHYLVQFYKLAKNLHVQLEISDGPQTSILTELVADGIINEAGQLLPTTKVLTNTQEEPKMILRRPTAVLTSTVAIIVSFCSRWSRRLFEDFTRYKSATCTYLHKFSTGVYRRITMAGKNKKQQKPVFERIGSLNFYTPIVVDDVEFGIGIYRDKNSLFVSASDFFAALGVPKDHVGETIYYWLNKLDLQQDEDYVLRIGDDPAIITPEYIFTITAALKIVYERKAKRSKPAVKFFESVIKHEKFGKNNAEARIRQEHRNYKGEHTRK